MKKALVLLSLALPVLTLAATAKKTTRPPSFKKIMQEHNADFQRCYDAELLRSKKRTAGRINLRVTLDQTGKVVESGPTQNTTKSRFLADCLVRVVEPIPFGQQKRPRTVFIHVFKFALPQK